MGDAYTFDLFITEREACTSELLIEFQRLDFPSSDEPVIAYSYHVTEWTDIGVQLGEIVVSEFGDENLTYNGEIITENGTGQ